MKQYVSYFCLYSLLKLCFMAETEENPPRNLTVTDMSLAPSIMSSNTTHSGNVSVDRSLASLLFIDNLRSRDKAGEGELSQPVPACRDISESHPPVDRSVFSTVSVPATSPVWKRSAVTRVPGPVDLQPSVR